MIGDIAQNYPNGFNPGQIDIINVIVDNKPAAWEVEGRDKTLLRVRLDEPLKKGKSVEIKMDFQEKLPTARTDFGYYKRVACFENWYPVLCVYDDAGWHKEPSVKIGECNFSEISDYVVEINLPEQEMIASTGKFIKEKRLDGGRKLVVLEADKVRDFTWVSSARFESVEKKHKGVIIKSYFINEDREKGIAALDFAVRALDFFNETFGEYPYDRLNIVETYLYGGAMEYPLLTSIGEQFYKYSDIKPLEGAVAHEIAHQWWYVVVGNNEYKEPWLDEALASYSEAMYFEKYYGEQMFRRKISSRAGLARFARSIGDSMDEFKNSSEYNIVVYMKGAYALDELRTKVGEDVFVKAIKKYYDDYKFKNATTSDFLNVINDICGEDAVEFFKRRLWEEQ